jgi:hypothetical protein
MEDGQHGQHGQQRQISYYYNGVLKAEETDLDLDGVMKIPIEGDQPGVLVQ